MKKIIFKTIGWVLMVICVIGIFQIDPVTSPWEFFLRIICVAVVNDIFQLSIEDYCSKARDWFIK